MLPLAEKRHVGAVPYDVGEQETAFPPIEPVRPPPAAPNILVVLLDDVGFGAPSVCGGPCVTRTAEELARGGLLYTRFHTTALCSPTRAALLTGRNHHSVGMGVITELATLSPGYTSVIPKSAASIAKILKYNGYSTAQFGKCHEVPTWETGPNGPFERWPNGNGFERFYGFVGGETSQWYPVVFEDNRRVNVPVGPEYHFMADMTDKGIEWLRTQRALAPDKPFFIYFAPGSAHAPHHVPREWADRYAGMFDDGWDAARQRTFERQIKKGVIPAQAQLTARPPQIPAWEDIPEALRPVLAREMEVYAGFLEYTDHHVGRLVSAIRELGALEDTLILYILGDNGASGEGAILGTFNEMINFNGRTDIETPDFLIAHKDELGGRSAYNHYAVGWAHAMDTPYQWVKQVASHWGGTRNGMVVHWPRGIAARGEICTQFHHVVDIAQTLLEVADLPEPDVVEGVAQQPMEGVSMAYTFDDPHAAERHETQYFEMFGNRGIYHRGFTAVTRHSIPWEIVGRGGKPFDDDRWELYDTRSDDTQAVDIAELHPSKLGELKRLFLIEAARHQVLPLDDRGTERLLGEAEGRPAIVRGTEQVLFDRMELVRTAVLDIKNRSHAITAEIVVPDGGARGIIVAQGTKFGGYALYAPEGKLKYLYNFLGVESYVVEAQDPLPVGAHQVRMEFEYDGGGLGKGGTATLFVDGTEVARGRVENTHATIFSVDATLGVGDKHGSPLAVDIATSGNRFSGEIRWARIDLDPSLGEEDRVIDAEQMLRVLLATH
ncbi:MAG: arylsulfatase [Polyangiaceae bacterium]